MPILTSRKLKPEEVQLIRDTLRYYGERVNWSSVDPDRERLNSLHKELQTPGAKLTLMLPKENQIANVPN